MQRTYLTDGNSGHITGKVLEAIGNRYGYQFTYDANVAAVFSTDGTVRIMMNCEIETEDKKRLIDFCAGYLASLPKGA